MARIELRNIHKRFGSVEVLQDVNLEIRDGEFLVLVGPSGCGKSTLLRMIAGLEPVSEGDILIGGERVNDLPPRDRDIAMVFQSYALYPHMDARRNMGFSLEIRRQSDEVRQSRVRAAAETLGLEPLLERLPKAMSGGQRQRVAMGRAIVRDPEAFLFDEPLSNLDAALRVEMRLEIAKLHQRLSASMIYVTHDQVEALTLADRIVVLDGGIVQQVGTPMELYETPANLFVARFIGSPTMNVLEARLRETGALELGDGTTLPLPAPPASPVARLGIRPEHTELAPNGDAQIEGTTSVVERLGAESNVYVTAEGIGQILCRHRGHTDLRPGDPVRLRLDLAKAHLFDPEGRALPRGGEGESAVAP